MMKEKKPLTIKWILAGIFLSGLLMAPVVYAQDDTDTFMLEEITVTAEKRETDLQKTPISIQTVSGTQLTTEAKQRIDDIMQGVVGVQVQGSPTGADFYMRGLGTADYGPPVYGANPSAVALYMDGVYQNRGEVVRGGTVDMAQAEVMRGTQSTTLGGSSLAGAVSLVSNNPVFDYEGSGSLGIGDYNLLTTQAVLNVPFADDQAMRIAYATEKRDGYLGSNAGDSDQANARIKYRFQPTETFDLVATASKQVIGGNGITRNSLAYFGYWESYDEDRAYLYDATIGYPVLYGHVNDGVKYDDRDNPWDDGIPKDGWPNNVFRHSIIYTYSVNLNWDLDIGTLTVIPSYQTAKFNSQETPQASGKNMDGTLQLREGWNAEKRKQETIQFDMQLASSADAPFEWLVGLYYYDTEFTGEMYSANFNKIQTDPMAFDYNPDLPLNEPLFYYDWANTDPSGTTSYNAYGNLSYPILDVLRLRGGLRYSKDKAVDRETRTRVVGDFISPDGDYVYDVDREAEWDAVTYRIGGEYDLSDQAMVYAFFSTGYQPGTWTMEGEATEKQELDQYTVGLKSRMLDNRLQLNVEGFHQMYYNRPFQGSLSYYSAGFPGNRCERVDGQTGATVNWATDGSSYCVDVGQAAMIPELLSMGADLEINFLITENDRIDATAEYLKSEQTTPDHGVTTAYLEEIGMDADLAGQVLSAVNAYAATYDGLQLQNSPEWSANFSYSHIFEMANGSTLTPKFNIEYRDSYWSAGGGPPSPDAATIAQPGNSIQDAYALYNFYLNWTSSDDKFNISAYVKNIDDTPVLSNYGTEGFLSVQLLPPRTMGVVFSVKL